MDGEHETHTQGNFVLSFITTPNWERPNENSHRDTGSSTDNRHTGSILRQRARARPGADRHTPRRLTDRTPADAYPAPISDAGPNHDACANRDTRSDRHACSHAYAPAYSHA